MPDVIEHLPVQLADKAGYVQAGMDECDAQSAALFTPDSDMVVCLVRAPRGKWMFDTSDVLRGDNTVWRQRWTTVADATAWLAERFKVTFLEVTL